MEDQTKKVLIGEILDPVSPEFEAALTSTQWELTDDVEGQAGWYRGMGQTEEDVEGQGFRWNYIRPVGEDDTEGQGSRFNGLGQTEDEDVEGQGYRGGFIRPIEGEDEDVVGLGGRYSGLGQTEEDVEGQVVRVRLRPEGEDDASGQGIKWRLGQGGDDTEGQGYRIKFQKPDVP